MHVECHEAESPVQTVSTKLAAAMSQSPSNNPVDTLLGLVRFAALVAVVGTRARPAAGAMVLDAAALHANTLRCIFLARIAFGAPTTIVEALAVALRRLVVKVGPCTSRILLWSAGVFDALVVVLASNG